MRGDAGVGADEAAVASTSLAVGAVRIAARTTPRADALPAMKHKRTGRKALEGGIGLTSAWSSTLKLAVWLESSFLPNLTEGSTWPLEALPTAGQTAVHRVEEGVVKTIVYMCMTWSDVLNLHLFTNLIVRADAEAA